jgi:hypothetical protein
MSSTEESKTVARSFYETYNGGDLQGAFDTYISRDLVNHTNGGAMDRELWMQSDLAAKVAMPDQTMTILGQAEDGDRVFTGSSRAPTPTESSSVSPQVAGRPVSRLLPWTSSGAGRSSSTTPSATSPYLWRSSAASSRHPEQPRWPAPSRDAPRPGPGAGFDLLQHVGAADKTPSRRSAPTTSGDDMSSGYDVRVAGSGAIRPCGPTLRQPRRERRAPARIPPDCEKLWEQLKARYSYL